MGDFHTTTEIVAAAERNLDREVWDYVSGGAETEMAIRRNREAIDALVFRPRILRDVSAIDTSRTLLGTRLRMPYILAPVGGLQSVTPDGAAAQVRGACRFGTLPVVSSVSLPSWEESAAAATSDAWFQLYVRGDLGWIEESVARVRASGYKALILTVDTAHYGNRERQKIQRYVPMGRREAAGENFQAMLDWKMVDRIKGFAGMPVGIKGIATAEDAQLALDHGVDVIWISNHGGRQLDHAIGTLEALPEVAEVVQGRVPVIVDGSFLRGGDILKAIALGATVVATGRMHAWALAAGGEEALVRMLEIVEYEMTTAMALLGVTALDQLNASYVRRADPGIGRGAFPLLDMVGK